MRPIYSNRREAGTRLADELRHLRGRGDMIVLALPRGGVPVAAEIARSLGAVLDVLPVRKLGVPGYPELAMGAIALGGIRIINQEIVLRLRISDEAIRRVAEMEGQELARREKAYRGDAPPPDIEGRIVILVDDGLATGATMRAAIAAVRQCGARRVIVAVPVAPEDTSAVLRQDADEVICPATPDPFESIGTWYRQFSQVSDDEVRQILAASVREHAMQETYGVSSRRADG